MQMPFAPKAQLYFSFSFGTQSNHRINPSGTTRGKPGGQESHHRNQNYNRNKSNWIGGTDPKQETVKQTGRGKSANQSNDDTDRDQSHGLAHHQTKDIRLSGSQSHPNSNFVSSLC